MEFKGNKKEKQALCKPMLIMYCELRNLITSLSIPEPEDRGK